MRWYRDSSSLFYGIKSLPIYWEALQTIRRLP
jgi:hypothetical protein